MENVEPALSSHNGEPPFSFSEKEILVAKENFERMAMRLNTLWTKEEPLSEEEEGEIGVILNSATIIEEILNGKMPEEFRQ